MATKQHYDPVRRAQRYIAYKERDKTSMRNYMRSFRLRILEMLGNKCSCKGEKCWHTGECLVADKRCLQVDHVKGGGSKQIDTVFKTNTEIYRYYLQRPIRGKRELQLLCANCNWIKKHQNKEGTLGDQYETIPATLPKVKERQYHP